MDGVLVVDKPEGLTSHDVVAVARRATGEKRIGHTGTLDPLATGVLPLACGRATRLVRFLTASDKEYEALVRFGMTTDSYDITGEETSRTDAEPSREAVVAAVESLRGRYMQMPPAYSAKKVGGRRAYDLARASQEVVLTAAPVRVSRAEVIEMRGNRASIAITCSAGFYVRSFAHELGIRVNAGACLEALRRTRSGEFHLSEATTLEALHEGVSEADLIPMERLLPRLRSVVLTDEGVARISHGRDLERGHYVLQPPPEAPQGAPDETRVTRAATGGAGPADASPAGEQEWVRIFDAAGRLSALATAGGGAGSLHPAIVLI